MQIETQPDSQVTAQFSTVKTSQQGVVGILELARPEKFNCLSTAVFDEIGAAFRQFEASKETRVVLLRALGKHFCTGAELPEVKRLLSDPAGLKRFLETGHSVLRSFERSKLPVIGAVQGLCLAGGLEVAMSCDVLFAAKTARFGDQHAQFGVLPGWGGSQRLTRLIGLRRAMDLFLSAKWIDADVAQAWGLVNYVSEDAALNADAFAFCETLSKRSSAGIAEMKRMAREGLDLALDDGLQMEVDTVKEALLSPDVIEGILAFEQRRTPVFR